ncbi:nicotinamide N-methyltransferase-like isoform X1 [Lissotriton helveticus]
MASFSELKELHERYLDAALMLETYTANDSAFLNDSVIQMLPSFNKIFSSGGVKGELLINLSCYPFFQWVIPACDYFSDIVLSGSTDQCVAVIEKWRRNEHGAVDWSHVAKAVCEFQGNRDAWPEKQNMLQRKIMHVVKYDISKINPLSPTVLPQADCLILPHCLETHVTDKEGFCSALRNASTLLKNGGHLILIACLDTTFYMNGSFKFPHLCMDASFVRKALDDAHYVIEELQVFPRKVNQLYDVIDYSSVILVHARKAIPVTCTQKP